MSEENNVIYDYEYQEPVIEETVVVPRPRTKYQKVLDDAEATPGIEDLVVENCNVKHITSRVYNSVSLRNLNLSNNSIRRIGPDVQNLVNLEKIDISYNKLFFVPVEVEFLVKLVKFIANNNDLDILPGHFWKLRSLQVLDLSNNKFEKVPMESGNLELLKELREWDVSIGLCHNLVEFLFNNNMLSEWPPQIEKCVLLEKLNLSYNKIPGVPVDGIVTLKKLNYLDLSHNCIEALPSCLYDLPLVHLNLSYNQLNDLPPGVVGQVMRVLKELNISHNKIKKLDHRVGFFPKLVTFNASFNQIGPNINESIGVMVNLSSLNLSHNELSDVPVAFKSLKSLIYLDCSYNSLTTINASVGMIPHLGHLDLSYNLLKEAPTHAFNLTAKLKKIFLNNNSIPSLPPAMFQHVQLVELNVSNNNLEQVQDEFIGLARLQILNMSNNKICRVSPGLGKLYRLEVLDLSRNRISSLPEELCELNKLRSLSIIYNHFSVVPEFLTKLACLRHWDLSWNEVEITSLESEETLIMKKYGFDDKMAAFYALSQYLEDNSEKIPAISVLIQLVEKLHHILKFVHMQEKINYEYEVAEKIYKVERGTNQISKKRDILADTQNQEKLLELKDHQLQRFFNWHDRLHLFFSEFNLLSVDKSAIGVTNAKMKRISMINNRLRLKKNANANLLLTPIIDEHEEGEQRKISLPCKDEWYLSRVKNFKVMFALYERLSSTSYTPTIVNDLFTDVKFLNGKSEDDMETNIFDIENVVKTMKLKSSYMILMDTLEKSCHDLKCISMEKLSITYENFDNFVVDALEKRIEEENRIRARAAAKLRTEEAARNSISSPVAEVTPTSFSSKLFSGLLGSRRRNVFSPSTPGKSDVSSGDKFEETGAKDTERSKENLKIEPLNSSRSKEGSKFEIVHTARSKEDSVPERRDTTMSKTSKEDSVPERRDTTMSKTSREDSVPERRDTTMSKSSKEDSVPERRDTTMSKASSSSDPSRGIKSEAENNERSESRVNILSDRIGSKLRVSSDDLERQISSPFDLPARSRRASLLSDRSSERQDSKYISFDHQESRRMHSGRQDSSQISWNTGWFSDKNVMLEQALGEMPLEVARSRYKLEHYDEMPVMIAPSELRKEKDDEAAENVAIYRCALELYALYAFILMKHVEMYTSIIRDIEKMHGLVSCVPLTQRIDVDMTDFVEEEFAKIRSKVEKPDTFGKKMNVVQQRLREQRAAAMQALNSKEAKIDEFDAEEKEVGPSVEPAKVAVAGPPPRIKPVIELEPLCDTSTLSKEDSMKVVKYLNQQRIRATFYAWYVVEHALIFVRLLGWDALSATFAGNAWTTSTVVDTSLEGKAQYVKLTIIRGKILQHLGLFDSAVDEYKRVLLVSSKLSSVAVEVFKCCIAVGNFVEAKEYYNKIYLLLVTPVNPALDDDLTDSELYKISKLVLILRLIWQHKSSHLMSQYNKPDLHRLYDVGLRGSLTMNISSCIEVKNFKSLFDPFKSKRYTETVAFKEEQYERLKSDKKARSDVESRKLVSIEKARKSLDLNKIALGLK